MKKLLSAGLLLFAFFVHQSADADSRKYISPCAIHYPSDDNIEWECRRLRRKDSLESLFGDRWQDVARFNRIDRRHTWPGATIKVPRRLDDIRDFSPLPQEIEYPEEEKFILIDLTEQFLGAYERGRLVFSTPVASGDSSWRTPTGEFRVTAFSRDHVSSLYKIEKTNIPYPMHYALRFLISQRNVAFWIHGRDIPGYPASHGCVGLYDEEMQSVYYRSPQYPLLDAARTLYLWAIGDKPDDGGLTPLRKGPKVLIVGEPPI